jgi:hypothetical protein
MIGDIVWGLTTTPTFKRLWRMLGRPHLKIRVSPDQVIDIRKP